MRIITLFFFVLITLTPSLTFGQKFDKTFGKPLIILTETDPWLMAIGSDVATFVLYEKGQIIYKSIENKQLKIYKLTLSQVELQKTIQSLLIPDAIYKMQDYIEISEATDQPSTIITLNIKKSKTITVYGKLINKNEARKKTPKEFLTLYDNIKKYKNKSAKEWMPNKIEVMFWDYDYAPNKRPWIKGFPDLNSPSTIKFDKDSYSVFIDKVNFEQFKKYYSTMGEKQAVQINGRKMAISYRLPFPNIK
jgi:hypothetical protein